MEAKGYEEKFPVADNSTEEGRQRNRRIDLRVRSK
jgi:flagellar motor protein MotB